MKLCIRNSVKNAHFVISLIIKYLSNADSEAKADICATECRIHKFFFASECRIHRCWLQAGKNAVEKDVENQKSK